jgi:hypothetical protein
MGHATPERQPGAAEITLARYTHVMPDAIETARVQLDRWLAAQLSASTVSTDGSPRRSPLPRLGSSLRVAPSVVPLAANRF